MVRNAVAVPGGVSPLVRHPVVSVRNLSASAFVGIGQHASWAVFLFWCRRPAFVSCRLHCQQRYPNGGCWILRIRKKAGQTNTSVLGKMWQVSNGRVSRGGAAAVSHPGMEAGAFDWMGISKAFQVPGSSW